jgi:hypothetical protein
MPEIANGTELQIAPPLSGDLSFSDSGGDFSKEADISPTCKVFWSKAADASCCVEKAGKYLEWKLDTISGYDYGNPVLSPVSGTEASKKYQNFETLIESDNYKVKETFVLKNKPVGNEFKIIINTNYDVIVREDGLIVHFCEDNDINNAVFYWGFLETVDASGLRTIGLYGQPDVDGNITFTLEQTFLDEATSPIYIDPTTYEISSSLDFVATQAPTYSCTKSSEGWFVAFPTGADVVCLRAESDPFSAWTTEFPDMIYQWTQRNVLVHFADGTLYFLGGANALSDIFGMFRDPGTDTWSERIKAFDGSGNTADNFDAVATDEIDGESYIFMLYGIGDDTKPPYMKKYTKSTDTWSDAAVPDFAIFQDHQFSLVYDQPNGKIHAFMRSTTWQIFHQAYDIATNTWDDSPTQISTSQATDATTQMTALCDSNGNLHVFYQDKAVPRGKIYVNNIGGWSEIEDLGLDYQTGAVQITKNDILIISKSISDFTGTVRLFEIGVDSVFGSPVSWWPGYNIRTFPKGTASIGEGEDVWGIGYDTGSTTLRYLVNSDYSVPGGGGNGDLFEHKFRPGLETPLRGGIR